MSSRADSGSRRSARGVEPTTSQKTTVTVFRAPGGAGSSRASAEAHDMQKRARGGLPWPQDAQTGMETSLGLAAHDRAGHSNLHERRGSPDDAPPVEKPLDGKETTPMAPAASLARLRKWMLDRVARKEVSVVQACREAGISTSRFYELRARYHAYGEAGLLPRPRPPRPDRRLSGPLTDQIVAYAIEHPTEGPRTIAAALGLARFGRWQVSHGGGYNVLRRAGLSRRAPRPAAAGAPSATGGGPGPG